MTEPSTAFSALAESSNWHTRRDVKILDLRELNTKGQTKVRLARELVEGA